MIILSIIIPVYNVEKYVRKTLESIFESTFPNNEVEVIVVNDGTKDNSMSIVNEFVAKYDNLKIINQENQGLSVARNTGLKAAQGKYVWFVDSDDWIEYDSLPFLLKHLEHSDKDVLMFKIREYDEEGRILFERFFHDNKNEEQISGTDVVLYLKKYGIDITPMQQYIIRRDFLLENNLFFVPGIYHEDMEFAPRMLITAERVSVIPKVIYCYLRRSSGSITTDVSLQKKRILSKIEIYKRYKAFGKKMKHKKDIEVLSYCQYRIVSYMWNPLGMDFIKEEGDKIGLTELMSQFKHDVWNNLFYDRKILHLLRQIIFLVSPYLLKKLHKEL